MDGDLEQKARAWDAIVRALDTAMPGWMKIMGRPSGVECAIAAIEVLAADKAPAQRWRTLEHGCQHVSFTPTAGHPRSFDPRSVLHLQAMRASIDEVCAEQLRALQRGASLVKGGLAEQRAIHDRAAAWPFPRGPMP